MRIVITIETHGPDHDDDPMHVTMMLEHVAKLLKRGEVAKMRGRPPAVDHVRLDQVTADDTTVKSYSGYTSAKLRRLDPPDSGE